MKENTIHCLKGHLNILLFPITYLWEARFFLHTSTKITYQNRVHAHVDRRIQLSFIKPDFKDIRKL